MIKRSEINAMNIDDFIRQEKREAMKSNKQKKRFFWSYKKDTNAIEALYGFVFAIAPCEHGWFCLCGNGTEDWMEKNFKSGLRFMGVSHYFK